MAKMGDRHADPHEEIPLDGIGGVNIIVKADVHRSGINFPAYAFENQAETEGFAKNGQEGRLWRLWIAQLRRVAYRHGREARQCLRQQASRTRQWCDEGADRRIRRRLGCNITLSLT